MSGRAEASGRIAMESSLHELALAGVLQMMTSSRRTGHVEVDARGDTMGDIYVVHGEVLDARAGQLEGEAALFHLLSLRRGTLRMRMMSDEEANEVKPTIQRALNTLLIEAAWREQDVNAIDTPEGVSVTRRIDDPHDEWKSFEEEVSVDAAPIAEKAHSRERRELRKTEIEEALAQATEVCGAGDIRGAVTLLEELDAKWPNSTRVRHALDCLLPLLG